MDQMSNDQLLDKLIEWFQDRCDGLWEHGSGITIETLDNPGWTIKVNIRDTPSESTPFEKVIIDNGENDWLQCFIQDGSFVGAGDPSKLPQMLRYFLTFTRKL